MMNKAKANWSAFGWGMLGAAVVCLFVGGGAVYGVVNLLSDDLQIPDDKALRLGGTTRAATDFKLFYDETTDDVVKAQDGSGTDNFWLDPATGDFSIKRGDFYMDGGVDKTWGVFRSAAEFTNIDAGALSTITMQAGDIYVSVLDFDKDAIESAFTSVALPASYDGGALRLQLFWTATAGTTGDSVWLLNFTHHQNDDAMNGTNTHNTISDSFIATNDLHISSPVTYTPDGAASGGGLLTVLVRRFATTGTDTFDADARFLGIKIDYL